MALLGQTTPQRGDLDVWDKTLFGQAVEKAKAKAGAAKQLAGEAMLAGSKTPLLPLVAGSKLLAPLTGIFIALIFTVGYQSGEVERLAAYLSEQGQVVSGYHYLGAVGTTLTDSVTSLSGLVNTKVDQTLTLSKQAPTVLSQAALDSGVFLSAAAGSVSADFNRSAISFGEGLKQIWQTLLTQAQSVGQYAWTSLKLIFDFFTTVLSDAYDGLLSGVGFVVNQIEMVLDGWLTKVGTTAQNNITNASLSAATMNSGLSAIGEKISIWWARLKLTLSSWWQGAGESWKQFLTQSQNNLSGSASDADLRGDIKEIKRDVKSLLNIFNTSSAGTSRPEGMIVVPSTGNAESDAVVKNRIADMFSDPVSVELDGTKRSGIITPVFSESGNDKYLFLLAPVNNQ